MIVYVNNVLILLINVQNANLIMVFRFFWKIINVFIDVKMGFIHNPQIIPVKHVLMDAKLVLEALFMIV